MVGGRGQSWMRGWIILGCVGSAVALAMLAMAASVGPGWPLSPTVFGLGVFNGVFAVAAIGSMMALAGAGSNGEESGGREGIRMGVWGAAQAIAFALGGFFGAVGVDIGRRVFAQDATAFLTVFALEATLFIAAAIIATRIDGPGRRAPTFTPLPGADHVQA